jgi:hypothetical protein
MGRPIKFEGSNAVLTCPPGRDDVQDMHVFRNGYCCVSCWEFTTEEIEEIARTGRVFLSVFSGRTQPPVYLGNEGTTKSVVADHGGVWK